MTQMKGITCCGDCGYYNWKKHKCTRATDEGDARSNFYADCPLPDVVPVQEPRVLTLDEVTEWHNIPESERDPIYVEYLPNSGLGISRWTIEYFGFNPNSYPNKHSGYYGKWLRCWTSRPTDEQRKAAKWDESI